VPGWIGDPGDGHLPGAAASASPAAASGAAWRARLRLADKAYAFRGGPSGPPLFFCARDIRTKSIGVLHRIKEFDPGFELRERITRASFTPSGAGEP